MYFKEIYKNNPLMYLTLKINKVFLLNFNRN